MQHHLAALGNAGALRLRDDGDRVYDGPGTHDERKPTRDAASPLDPRAPPRQDHQPRQGDKPAHISSDVASRAATTAPRALR